MKKFAWISRHLATPEQIAIAKDMGVELVPVGDIDAFTGEIPAVFDGIACAHAAMAARAIKRGFSVGVFENANRAAIGEKPTFVPIRFHIFWM